MIKNILITGAGSGIGQALAWEMAAGGAHVFIVGRRLEKLQETARAFPEKISLIQANVGQPAEREKIVSRLHGIELDYLVHNAGVADPVNLIADLTLEAWRETMSINLEAPIFLTQALLPQLKIGSRILNISTGLAHRALNGALAYCASKAALHMAYLAFNSELNSKGIYAGSVMPGIVDTAMQTHLRAQDAGKLPDVDLFKGFKTQKALRSSAEVGALLAVFLETTSQAVFTQKDWRVEELEAMFAEINPSFIAALPTTA